MKDKYLFNMSLGDWSNDGHGYVKKFTLETNYPKEDIQEAYLDTCEKLDLYLHANSRGTSTWKNLLCNYEQSFIDEEAWYILIKEAKVLSLLDKLKIPYISKEEILSSADAEDEDEAFEIYLEALSSDLSENLEVDYELLRELFMLFVSLSLPNDFKYSFMEIPELFGYWDKKLNISVGYGIYD